MRTQVTAPAVRSRKMQDGREPLVMVTAYDAPGARMADEAGVDLLLVCRADLDTQVVYQLTRALFEEVC